MSTFWLDEQYWDDIVAYWEDVVALADQAAAPVANAMAAYITERTRNITLRETSHAPGEWYRQGPRRPPAYSTGTLARGMFYKPASAGTGSRATAEVGNRVNYSRILEYGCVITPASKKMLHWKDSGSPVKGWFHEFLVVPPHPFIEPTFDSAIRDGSLFDVMVDEFRKYDP